MTKKIKVSEIKIKLLPNPTPKGIFAYVSCVINNSFKINQISIATSLKRRGDFRIIYPIIRTPEGTYIQAIFPINKTIAEVIENNILSVFYNIINNNNLTKK